MDSQEQAESQNSGTSLDDEKALDSLDYAEAEEQRLIRKIDWLLLPILTVLYLLSFLDRSNIGNAKIEGLVTDIGIKDYNTLLAIFFVGYVIAEVPSNLVLKVTSPTIWLPTITIIWGIISTTMGLVHNEQGMYAARFFLGVTEAGLFPGVVYVLSTYYKRRERTARVSFFFSAAAASGAFGGVLAFGLGRINGGGKPGWAWIFIVEGLLTVVIALASYFIIPTWPSKTRFLTPREKAIIQHRLQCDSDAFEEEKFEWSEVRRALTSPQIYGYSFLFHGFAFALYTVSLFLPTIIQNLGYRSWEAQLLTVPPYVFAFVITMSTAFASNKFKLRAPFIIASAFVSILGYIVLLTSPTTGGRYAACFLLTAGVYSGNALLLAWPSENLMGHTYRATGLAMMIGIGDVGAIVGTELYRTPLGHLTNKNFKYSHILAIIWLLFGVLAAASLYVGLSRQNAKWDAEGAKEKTLQMEKREEPAKGADMLIKWKKDFRYQL